MNKKILLTLIILMSIFCFLSAKTKALKKLKKPVQWFVGESYEDLSELSAASAAMVVDIKEGDSGILMESGGSVLGLALYVDEGKLYFQCGNGEKFQADGQAVCIAEVKPGKLLIEWSADADKGKVTLFVNGKEVDSYQGEIARQKVCGNDVGGIGTVHDNICITVFGYIGHNGDNLYYSLEDRIKSCFVFPGKSIF